ncbi:hypothetical protein C9374_010143 [Naegleria lovaniensis]|uniref:[RNA-polymerase]-subunit kinase n=1 Tax=Naegleria lovaniensis TaxID=51637 RepID=A0AA88KG90_NAELO|nr:uncharacterized protein C9374_010143 [Naegleria lovaniensis]KAG2375139.1 hypothetical protein C9374_010143 [Naegleria lovaniensis]
MLDYLLAANQRSTRYEKMGFIGEGTFGRVYKAKDLTTSQIVAIKKIKLGVLSSDSIRGVDEGVSFSAIREVKSLQEIKHSNILNLLDVFVNKKNINLVFEYCGHGDLEQVIKESSIILQECDIKQYMKMILEAVDHCHRHWVLHRDLKPSNLLLWKNEQTNEIELKLADFGLAKIYGSPDKRYSPQCVTRWYRAPELLFGAELYGPSVDLWSVGCIFAELMLRVPLFPGDSDIDQLGKIFACLGTPSEEEWPGVKLLPNYIEFEPFPKTDFSALFTAASRDAIDLISKLLVFDPNKRITAQQALKHPYFTRGVQPTPKTQIPVPKRKHAADSYQHLSMNHDDQERRDFESHTKMYGGELMRPPANPNIIGKVLNFEDSPGNTSGLSSYSVMSLVGPNSLMRGRDSFGSVNNSSMLSNDEVMGEATSTPQAHNKILISPASNLSVLSNSTQKRSFNESGIATPTSFIGEEPIESNTRGVGLFDDEEVAEAANGDGDDERSVRRKLDL